MWVVFYSWKSDLLNDIFDTTNWYCFHINCSRAEYIHWVFLCSSFQAGGRPQHKKRRNVWPSRPKHKFLVTKAWKGNHSYTQVGGIQSACYSICKKSHKNKETHQHFKPSTSTVLFFIILFVLTTTTEPCSLWRLLPTDMEPNMWIFELDFLVTKSMA